MDFQNFHQNPAAKNVFFFLFLVGVLWEHDFEIKKIRKLQLIPAQVFFCNSKDLQLTFTAIQQYRHPGQNASFSKVIKNQISLENFFFIEFCLTNLVIIPKLFSVFYALADLGTGPIEIFVAYFNCSCEKK